MVFQLTTASPTFLLPWNGQWGFFDFKGTWGGGTVAVTFQQQKASSGSNTLGSGVSVSADINKYFVAGTGYLLFTLSGSTGAALSISASPVSPATGNPT